MEENAKTEQNSLVEIDSRIQQFRESGKLKKLLEIIHIDENGQFQDNRKHSYWSIDSITYRELKPLRADYKTEEETIWGFGWIPEIEKFDSHGKFEGKT